MVIAFYPGGGGNRYLRMLQGLYWNESQISYDHLVKGQDYRSRYLLTDECYKTSDYVLTHCMNITHIQKKLPGHDVCFIIGNLKQCLQREWILHGHERYIKKIKVNATRIDHYNAFKDESWPVCVTSDDIDNLPSNLLAEITQDFNNVTRNMPDIGVLKTIENNFVNKVNSAYEGVKWHTDYYSAYPVDYSFASSVVNIDLDNCEFSKFMKKELNVYRSDVFDEVWDALNV